MSAGAIVDEQQGEYEYEYEEGESDEEHGHGSTTIADDDGTPLGRRRHFDVGDEPDLMYGGPFGDLEYFAFETLNALTPDSYRPPTGPNHLAWKFFKTDSKLIRSTFNQHGFREIGVSEGGWNMQWSGCHIRPPALRGLQAWQKVNHFPKAYEITRKDKMFKNIHRMQLNFPGDFDFIPMSFCLPDERAQLVAAWQSSNRPYIVKPATLSRGRGVFLLNDEKQLDFPEAAVGCEYINNPLLINGYKFDLRIYVGVTSFNPLRIYIHELGLTRFATEKYDPRPESFQNRFMHLTNYSVNKKNRKFVKNKDPEVDGVGSKWSLGALQRHLQESGIDTDLLFARIDDLIVKSLISVEEEVGEAVRQFVPHPGNCFELYGFDVMVDDTLKPWLLEVNLTPSLSCDSPLDMRIKSTMTSDLFTMVAFTPPVKPAGGAKSRTSLAKYMHRRMMARADLSEDYRRLSSDDLLLLLETVDEEKRCGSWRRLYPAENAVDYQRFFARPGFGHYSPAVIRCLYNGEDFPVYQPPAPAPAAGRSSKPPQARAGERERTAERTRIPGKAVKASTAGPLSASSSSAAADPMRVDGAPKAKRAPTRQADIAPPGPSAAAARSPIGRSTDARNGALDLGRDPARDVMQRPPSTPPPTTTTTTTTAAPAVQPPATTAAPFDIRSLLAYPGPLMSPVQARRAFAQYLSLVRARLVSLYNPPVNKSQRHEALNIIERFLRRTSAVDDSYAFPPPLAVFQERLEAVLEPFDQFYDLYVAETASLVASGALPLPQAGATQSGMKMHMSDDLFDVVLGRASEGDMEQLLSRFAEHVPDVDFFLGAGVSRRGAAASGTEPTSASSEPRSPGGAGSRSGSLTPSAGIALSGLRLSQGYPGST